MFLYLLVAHPYHFVGFDVGELQVDLVGYHFLLFVRVHDAVDGALQDKVGAQFFTPFLGGFGGGVVLLFGTFFP